MEKINFQDNVTKANANTFNTLQDNIEDAISYSTDEIQIGKWIDGKPIYRKVNVFNSTQTGFQQFNHGIENIDVITKVGGIAITSEGWFRPLPASITVDNLTLYSYGIEYATKNLITLIRGTQSSNATIYVVLEYTKTTD